MKTTDLIKDSLNHSSWRRGFLQDASETEDFESDPKIVKFVVVKKREERHAEKEDLMSFEAVMLPHLDAAHNLAKWLLRNEQDAQMWSKRRFCARLNLSVDSMAPMAGPGC